MQARHNKCDYISTVVIYQSENSQWRYIPLLSAQLDQFNKKKKISSSHITKILLQNEIHNSHMPFIWTLSNIFLQMYNNNNNKISATLSFWLKTLTSIRVWVVEAAGLGGKPRSPSTLRDSSSSWGNPWRRCKIQPVTSRFSLESPPSGAY